MFIETVANCELVGDEDVNPSVSAALFNYNQGYERGLSWPDAWESHGKPGGPWVYSGRNAEESAKSRFENRVWRAGWEDGHKVKLNGR